MQKLDTKAIIPLTIGPFIVITILAFIALLITVPPPDSAHAGTYPGGLGGIWLTALAAGAVLGVAFAMIRYKSYGYV